jgi:hypothetical protein
MFKACACHKQRSFVKHEQAKEWMTNKERALLPVSFLSEQEGNKLVKQLCEVLSNWRKKDTQIQPLQ